MTKGVYIPKGENIRTRNGCICKNEYKSETGNTYKNACNTDNSDANEPWCLVEGKCGKPIKGGPLNNKWWDQCNPEPRSILDSKIKYGKDYFTENMKGIIIYVIIFVIAIPTFLYKRGHYDILEVYMPNLDLLATAVSWGGGPGSSRMFQELYNPKSDNLMGYLSTLLINYLSLLGLTYIVARRVNITKSVSKGWGIGFIMLLLTYLVPNEIISAAQYSFSERIFGLQPGQGKSLPIYISTVGLGLAIATSFILVEKFILANHKIILDPFVKELLKFDVYFTRLFGK